MLVQPPAPPAARDRSPADRRPVRLPRWERGEEVATRRAYGEALKALGEAWPDVVAIDAEVGNSTYTQLFAEAFPARTFQSYIAEQQMIGTAVGVSVRGFVPFAATFAAFLTRAHDFIRMAAVSGANIRLCGSHAGVSIGEDGPSQMGLEDIAMLRAIHGSTVLYPCDANQAAHLVMEMATRQGIQYLRTTRADTPVIYDADEEFPVGGSKVLRRSANDVATIVAAGIMVHEALQAADTLAAEGTPVRVLDAYSVKPIDVAALRQAADETGMLITVEDHRREGGLGSAVLEALAAGGGPIPPVDLLAVTGMPGSASPAELLDDHGISARCIVDAIRAHVARQQP